MAKGGGQSTTTIDVPPEFKPAFTALFNSAFGAARTAAGQEGFGTLPPAGAATQLANLITGSGPGQNPFAPPEGFSLGGENPFATSFPKPSSNIFEVKPASHVPGHVEISPVGDTLAQLQAANPEGFGPTATASPTTPIPTLSPIPNPTGAAINPVTRLASESGGAAPVPSLGGGTQPFGTEPLAPAPTTVQPTAAPAPTAPTPAPTQAPAPAAAPTAAPTAASISAETQAELVELLSGSGFLGRFQTPQQQQQLTDQIAAIFAAGQQQVAPINAAAGEVGQGDLSIPLTAGPPIIGQPFGEQFTAGTSPLEFESLAQREAIARQLEGIGNPILDLGNFTAQGGFLDPESNPFLVQNIEAAIRPITQQFRESTVPNFESQAIQSGAFKGSSARDLAFNQLASRFGQQVLDTGTGIAFENFQRERVLQQNAGQLLDQGALLNQLSPELLARVGLGQRELAQRPLDEALLQFRESITAPFRPLFPLASIIQGQDIGSIFSQQVPTPSALSTGIVGALGGAQAGASIFDLLGGTGGGGAGLSAALGGLLGGAGGAFG